MLTLRSATRRLIEFKTRAIATLHRVPASSAIHTVIGVAEAANGNWLGCCCAALCLGIEAMRHR